jgi:hypothetical protein
MTRRQLISLFASLPLVKRLLPTPQYWASLEDWNPPVTGQWRAPFRLSTSCPKDRIDFIDARNWGRIDLIPGRFTPTRPAEAPVAAPKGDCPAKTDGPGNNART